MTNKLYFFAGGGVIAADTAEEFVQKMRMTSIKPYATEELYMYHVSERCNLYNDSYIRVESYECFLKDLIDNDFVFVINTN